MNAEELFLQKYGNKITASESWVIRFAEEYAKLKTDAVLPQADVSGSLVTFDFDGTLSRTDVQEYALELISKGVDVWVVTSRYDELHKHRYQINPTNDDLWEVIDKLNIPRWKVRFTCMEWKANYLFHTNAIFHLDDNNDEFFEMRKLKCKTKGIQVSSGGFQNKCNRILLSSLDYR